jgi:hypothetical protein
LIFFLLTADPSEAIGSLPGVDAAHTERFHFHVQKDVGNYAKFVFQVGVDLNSWFANYAAAPPSKSKALNALFHYFTDTPSLAE